MRRRFPATGASIPGGDAYDAVMDKLKEADHGGRLATCSALRGEGVRSLRGASLRRCWVGFCYVGDRFLAVSVLVPVRSRAFKRLCESAGYLRDLESHLASEALTDQHHGLVMRPVARQCHGLVWRYPRLGLCHAGRVGAPTGRVWPGQRPRASGGGPPPDVERPGRIQVSSGAARDQQPAPLPLR